MNKNNKIKRFPVYSLTNELNKFGNYCIKNELYFQNTTSGNIYFIEIIEKFFQKTFTHSSIQFYKKKLKNLGFETIFKNKMPMNEKIQIFYSHCKLKLKQFEKCKNGYLEMKLEWNNFFNENNTLSTIISIAMTLRKEYKDLFILPKKNTAYKLDKFINYCLKENITFEKSVEGYKKMQTIFSLIFKEKHNLNTIIYYRYSLSIEDVGKIFYQRKILSKNQKFVNYCLNKKIMFDIEKIKGKNFFNETISKFQKIWFKLFKIKLKDSSLINLINKIKKHHKELFNIKKLELNDLLIKFGEYCIKNNITFNERKNISSLIQKTWYECIGEKIDLKKAQAYNQKLKNIGYKQIFINYTSFNFKAEILLKYCNDNNIYFDFNTSRYDKINMIWEKCFGEKLTYLTTKNYSHKLSKLGLKERFNYLTKINKNDLFYNYCITNSKKFIIYDYDYKEVIFEWKNYFGEDISRIAIMNNIKKILIRYKKDIFEFLNTSKEERIIKFANYCIEYNIKFKGSTSENLKSIQLIWEKLYSKKLQRNTINGILSRLKNFGYGFLFSQKDKNTNIKDFIEYCKKNDITFNPNKIDISINTIWFNLFSTNITRTILNEIKNKFITNNHINLSFKKTHTYYDNFKNLIYYLIKNNESIEIKNFSDEDFIKLYNSYYIENIDIESSKTKKELFLKEYKIINSEKINLFRKYCKDNLIVFEYTDENDNIILIWRKCFDDEEL